ncbi:hypothetical protein [Streptomyces chumphonensis]|uniref:hypothetical protein n=1 Tax=Streptomyces chumphonensis TaxID=1214925 RepID=UPI003D75FAE7
MSTVEYEPRAPQSPGAWNDRSSAALGAPPRRHERPAADGAPRSEAPAAVRREPADPVRPLLHQHRELCARAVDPLEIAAALEAHGVNDRAAARYRHRDVFGLAEELFARSARLEPPAPPKAQRPRRAGRRARWPRTPGPSGVRTLVRAALTLLPGTLCALALSARFPAQLPAQLPASLRWPAALLSVLLVAAVLRAALRTALRGVPLGWPPVLAGGWLLGYALLGDGLLGALLDGGALLRPAPRWVALSLAFAVAPAAWCVHRFAAGARLRLAVSRSLGAFAARARPLLAGILALCCLALLVIQAAARYALTGAPLGVGGPDAHLLAGTAAVTATGLLLFTALLLAAHGFPRPAALGLAVACAVQALALGWAAAADLPGLDAIDAPLRRAVDAAGPAVVQAAACGLAWVCLLAPAVTHLTGAAAHHPLRGAYRPEAATPAAVPPPARRAAPPPAVRLPETPDHPRPQGAPPMTVSHADGLPRLPGEEAR